MTIDLSQFHQVFYEESFEGLDVMEAALMELDPANIDDETINAIFRSAHSIKGGSATFGFSSVAEFTHDLETILDQVRSGKRGFRGEDVNTCLKSVDCMREMLQLLQAGEDGYTPLSKELKAVFAALLDADATAVSPSNEGAETLLDTSKQKVETSAEPKLEPIEVAVGKNDSAEKYYQIHFFPDSDILKTGNDVVRMFRELSEISQMLDVCCRADALNLASLNPEDCLMSWTILLKTRNALPAINEVFEWVADESKITITETEIKQVWEIDFAPSDGILLTGNEPIRLFRALEELGDITVAANTDKLPSLELLDHERCLLSWNIILRSADATEDTILEVFEWVLDESRVSVLLHDSTGAVALNEEVGVVPAVAVGTIAAPVGSDAMSFGDTASVTDITAVATPIATPIKTPQAAPAKKVPAEPGSIRVGIDKVDNLINMVGELVITQSMLGQLGTEFEADRLPKLMEGLGQLEQNTRELQESVMRIRMLPISFAFSRFPRMIRDLGQTLNKQLHLEMIGEHTELDKTVMEKIGDPLVHLVRNAVDHGIELPDERVTNGKPALGTITLNAYHQGGNVVIEITDDGKGLDKIAISEKAIEKGIISANEAELMPDEAVFDLIFQPGFSTAQTVSDVSGRGVGMDVVKRNIQALNGSVEIRSQVNVGSTITIRLPLTLAILDGQLVRVGHDTYIFPLVSIVESLQCRKEFISKVAGGCDVFKLRDDYVPIIELHKTFSVPEGTPDLEQSLMVVVEADGEKIGIVVDELLAQQQVVIKSLENNYRRVDGISGATILGDGTVALILDIVGIVKLAGEKFGIAHHLTHGRNFGAQVLPTQAIG